MEYEILVDGYNVIKNNVMFQAMEMRGLAEARDLLIRQLKNRYGRSTHHIIVVFDGNGPREEVSHIDHIKVIFSRHGETADQVIVRLSAEARKAGRNVKMYSDDEEVRDSVSQDGTSIHTTKQLTTQFYAAPRDLTYLSRHRQHARRVYGLDPSRKLEDELPDPPRHSKKKRKPPRNRS